MADGADRRLGSLQILQRSVDLDLGQPRQLLNRQDHAAMRALELGGQSGGHDAQQGLRYKVSAGVR